MGFLGPILILGSKKISKSDISANVMLVAKICNHARISHILTNFFPNVSALNSKHFTN